MKIVLFTHPSFSASTSMPRFAKMLIEGMTARGHVVHEWSAKALFVKIPSPRQMKKWLGYLDQFLVFPAQVLWRSRSVPAETLFVFADHGLGPLVPIIRKRKHVIHCHDFTALRCALGEIEGSRSSWSGRMYQSLIRWGFSTGANFICVSARTQRDLHRLLLGRAPLTSIVVPNGLNYPFAAQPRNTALERLRVLCPLDLKNGFILHVGGNQWYKNRVGVLEIYSAYLCRAAAVHLPLLLIGVAPDRALLQAVERLSLSGSVAFCTDALTADVEAAYSAASVLLFPSLSEGFGWPVAEALACGCPVLTTGEEPMTEVGGGVASYIPLMPVGAVGEWADVCATSMTELIERSDEEKREVRLRGLQHAQEFDAERAYEMYELAYQKVVQRRTA